MRRALKLPLAVLLLVSSSGMALAESRTIVQKGRRFAPTEVSINRGDSLTFTNEDEFIHQIYVAARNFAFDTDEREPGQNITQRFTESGTFEVRCHIHPKMKLAVSVK